MLQHSCAYHFRGRIELQDFGRMVYNTVFLPPDLPAVLPLRQYPRLRVDAIVGKLWLNGALQSAKKGKYLLRIVNLRNK